MSRRLPVSDSNPALILNREKDTVFRSRDHEFPTVNPRARVELIPRARHLANFDDPDGLSDAVRRFACELTAVG
ncbi:alpha/beta fold hydrolase [Streptomyces sp. OR43]|uniref:alpha/beta fold hydrolase n=1 Tax=Streptomyces sp. or43 TaxID=2478957 RepID=UPI001650F986|nr:hypothetical protein [Streptomyces sp. or43]